MSKDFVQIASEVMTGVGALRQGAPDTLKAFAGLASAATASKALDTKTKELMAVAISIAVHCEGCVAFHTKMAHRNGANREELLETVALAIYMGGGPAAVYGADALGAPSINSSVPPASAVAINMNRGDRDARNWKIARAGSARPSGEDGRAPGAAAGGGHPQPPRDLIAPPPGRWTTKPPAILQATSTKNAFLYNPLKTRQRGFDDNTCRSAKTMT